MEGCLLFWVLLIGYHAVASHTLTAKGTIDLDQVVFRTDPAFLSFNIDAAELRPADPGGSDFLWSSPRLVARAKHLTPAKLRIGGGAQSKEIYNNAFLIDKLPQVVGLARAINATLIWGTAPCRIRPHHCDMSNAAALVNSSVAVGIDEWEFGNEPSSSSNMSDLAFAFLDFKRLLESRFASPKLIGPDVGYGTWHSAPSKGSLDEAFLADFFKIAGNVLDGATIHIYPFDHSDVGGDDGARTSAVATGDPHCRSEAGKNLPWCNYTRVMWPGPGELFDTRPAQDFALPFAEIVRKDAPHAARSLRIGETAAVNHGGWDNVTNAFVSGFWSVYEMGWLAQAGYAVMSRQSLACRAGDSGMGGAERCSYSLLSNSPDFEPLPDYWLTLLHKRLMGRTVLNATVSRAVGDSIKRPTLAPVVHVPDGLYGVIRLFAHCSAAGGGGVTLMYANPQNEAVNLRLDDILTGGRTEEYVLTPAADDTPNPPLQSKRVALNGVPLQMTGTEDSDLPLLSPRVGMSELILPELSYGFVVLPDAKASACESPSSSIVLV